MYTDKKRVNTSVLTVAENSFNVFFILIFVYYLLISLFSIFLTIY